MTRPFSLRAFAAPAPVALLLAVLAGGMPSSAAAQQDIASVGVPGTIEAIPPTEAPVRPTEQRNVGDATHHLLAIQREGRVASPTPRPLAGEVASLSYQRYLDSFKHPIPERFSTTVQKAGSSGGSR